MPRSSVGRYHYLSSRKFLLSVPAILIRPLSRKIISMKTIMLTPNWSNLMIENMDKRLVVIIRKGLLDSSILPVLEAMAAVISTLLHQHFRLHQFKNFQMSKIRKSWCLSDLLINGCPNCLKFHYLKTCKSLMFQEICFNNK